MQNLSTTHADDIRERDDLFIPSWKAKVSFIDTKDLGEIIRRSITEEGHKNKVYIGKILNILLVKGYWTLQ